jgi:hypothetical protein
MAQGMMVLDVLIVSVALPAMQRELHLIRVVWSAIRQTWSEVAAGR